jgi:hypothetical protein
MEHPQSFFTTGISSQSSAPETPPAPDISGPPDFLILPIPARLCNILMHLVAAIQHSPNVPPFFNSILLSFCNIIKYFFKRSAAI